MIEINVTDQITLTMLSPSDAESLFALVEKNRSYLKQWLPWLDHNTELAHTQAFIASTMEQYHKNLGFACGIWFNQTLVGMCSYHPINRKNNSVDIGYWLDQDHQGLGIITHSAQALIDYAFTTLKLNKVCIPVATGNQPSQGVVKRLNLVCEGTEREAEYLYDRYVDHYKYSILHREWLDTHPAN